MNAFAIFATVLTIGYVIYYGIVISQDIIASKKQATSTVETFNVSEISEPAPTVVSENGDGYSVNPTPTTILLEENPEENVSAVETSDEVSSSKTKEQVEEAKQYLEPIVEDSVPGFDPDQLEAMIALQANGGSEPIIKLQVIDSSFQQPVDAKENEDESEDEIRV